MNSVCRKCLLKVVYVIADVEDDVGESIVDSFVTSDNLAQLDNIIFTFQFRNFSVSKLVKYLRVLVSVSENLVSQKKARFRFRKNFVSEKSLGFGKFGLNKEKI